MATSRMSGDARTYSKPARTWATSGAASGGRVRARRTGG